MGKYMVLVLLLLSSLVAQSELSLTPEEKEWLKENREVVLGVDKFYTPLNFENKQQIMDGMNVDFIHFIEKKLGIHLHLDAGRWSDVLQRALDHSNDGIVNADKSSDKEGSLLFTESFVHHPLGLFMAADADTIADLSSLNAMKIAIKEHTSTIDYIRIHYPGAKIIPVDDNVAALRAVSKGEVDAAVDFYSVLDALSKQHAIPNVGVKKIFFAEQIGMSRIGIRKSAPLLVSAINKAIVSMDIEERAAIISRWIDNNKISHAMKTKLNLTEEEKEWLLSHPRIRVGFLENWTPIQYFGSDGNPQGLSKEYLMFLDSILPVSFDILPLPDSPEERLKQIDLVPSVSVTDERKKIMAFTETYLELPVLIFASGKRAYVGTLNAFRGKRVAVRSGFAVHEWLKEEYPDIEIITVKKVEDGLHALSRGDVDAYIGNPYVTGYAIEKNHFFNISVVGETEFVYRHAMGVRKELAPFIPILNKALAQITPTQKEEYFRKHMNFVYEKQFDKKPFFQVGGALVLLLLLVLYWNHRLSKEIESRKAAEEITQHTIHKLRDSEQKFKLFFESVDDAIFIHDLKGHFLEVNRIACERLGYTRDELLEFTFHDIDVPLEGVDPREGIEKILKGGSLLCEGAHRAKSGEVIPIEISAHLIEYNGKAAVMSLVRDIRERKSKEATLQEYSEKLSLALESTNAGIWQYNLRDSTLLWDDRMFELYGIKQEDYPNAFAAWESSLHPDDIKRALQELHDAKEGGRNFDTKFRIVLPNGEIRFIEAHALIKRDSSDKPLIMVGVNFDITEKMTKEQQLIESEQSLREAKENAECALRSKSDFLANMSHEIRTPLNAVTGFSELLEGMVTDVKQRSYLASIKMAGKTLLKLINDVLDLSKMEAGRMRIHFEFFNLDTLFSEMEQIFSLKAEEKSLQLRFECEAGLGEIKLDEIRIRQILLNLIGNALKFTSSGSIHVSANMEKKNGTGTLYIRVKDSGIGIPLSDQARIFEDFQQQEQHDRKEYGGTGLGLAISQRLVEMQGGAISVESEVGAGATFILCFPNVEWRDPLLEPDSMHNATGVRAVRFEDSLVWIADDVLSNLVLLQELLLTVGLRCQTFENGRELLEALEKTTPDLIITDLRMPVLGGVDMTKELESKENFAVPIIALTASSSEDDLKENRLLFDAFLRKPVDIPELYSTIKQFLPVIHTEAPVKEEECSDEISKATLEYLETVFATKLESLKGAMMIDDVKDLGEALLHAVDGKNESCVERFALSIITAAEAFDIKAINGLQQRYHRFIQRLKKSE